MITGPCYRCKGTGCISYPALTRVMDAAPLAHWCSTRAVADAVELDSFHVAAQLKELFRRGLVERRGKGTRGAPHVWRRSQQDTSVEGSKA